MTPVEHMVLMSKHSRPEDILATMREKTCKHMPLTDDFSGQLLFIADIRDIVSSITSKPKQSGKGSSEAHAKHDTGRDSIWVSNAGKQIDFRSLSSRLNLVEAADAMNLNPFGDGFHVVWDQHRASLIDGATSFDAETLNSSLQNAVELMRQSSMETWPPP